MVLYAALTSGMKPVSSHYMKRTFSELLVLRLGISARRPFDEQGGSPIFDEGIPSPQLGRRTSAYNEDISPRFHIYGTFTGYTGTAGYFL